MGENVDQIEKRIRDERRDLGRNLRALEHKAKDLTDWRVYYRRNPAWFLGGAAGVGVLLAFALKQGLSAPEPARVRYIASPATSAPNSLKSRAGHQLNDTWMQITDALLAVGAAKLLELVTEAMPALKHHLDGRPGSRPKTAF